MFIYIATMERRTYVKKKFCLGLFLLFGVIMSGFSGIEVSADTFDETDKVVSENNLGKLDSESSQQVNQVDNFEDVKSIDQVMEQIDNFYLSKNDSMLRAAAGTKWKAGTKVWDGHVGYFVTSYFWVKGKDMSPYFVVGKAQRKAVTAKYGKVNNNTSYKMKTTQHITLSGKWSYKTISATAVCYGK